MIKTMSLYGELGRGLRDRIDSAEVNPYRAGRNGESNDLRVIRESTDAEGWPGFGRNRSFIIASRRLRDVQIGSGSTERRRQAGGGLRWPLVSASRWVCASFTACGVADSLANVREIRYLVAEGTCWLYARLSPWSQCQRKRFNR